jgi:hypothetical protein
VLTVNKLLFFFPRAADFLCACLAAVPIIAIIGNRGVTGADPELSKKRIDIRQAATRW